MGPSSLRISIDVSRLSQVPNRLSISHDPTTTAPLTATAGTTTVLSGINFVESLGEFVGPNVQDIHVHT